MIARSHWFQNVTLAVIAANSIYLGVDTELNDQDRLADVDLSFKIFEHSFCIFFTIEWMVRFGSFKYKSSCCRDGWFKFDSLLACIGILETWIIPVWTGGELATGGGVVKMLRMLRLARVTRLMRAFPELVLLFKGIMVASRAVWSALLMLAFLVYVFAIVMHTLLKGEAEHNEEINYRFSSLALTMWSLLIDGTFMESLGSVSRAFIEERLWLQLVVLALFVLTSSLTVLNMLLGILCEVVSRVAASERESIAVHRLREDMLHMLVELDEDGSGTISRAELHGVLQNDDVMELFFDLHVDPQFFSQMTDMSFETGPMGIHEIMELILDLRGDRSLQMKDFIRMSEYSHWRHYQTSCSIAEWAGQATCQSASAG